MTKKSHLFLSCLRAACIFCSAHTHIWRRYRLRHRQRFLLVFVINLRFTFKSWPPSAERLCKKTLPCFYQRFSPCWWLPACCWFRFLHPRQHKGTAEKKTKNTDFRSTAQYCYWLAASATFTVKAAHRRRLLWHTKGEKLVLRNWTALRALPKLKVVLEKNWTEANNAISKTFTFFKLKFN